jgi:hypothetical protein
MFESGGIGAQIDKKVGALTGNPQAMQQLQQKQKTQQGKGVTPDLLDALALQKVMSDKALAKQQLALSQQQDAGTVVEQMEQKLVGMNKEELTAQTAGILGERNKKRQQQVSSGKPPQQQGQRPPLQMAQGAPQGLPAAPRPPTQFAAQGGIIGYAAAGKVSAKEAEKKRIQKLLSDKNITSESWQAMSPEEQQRVAKVLNISQDNTTIGKILASPLAAAEDLIRAPFRMASNLGTMVGNTDIGQSLGLGEIGQDKPMTSYLDSTNRQQEAMKTQDRVTGKGISGALDIPEVKTSDQKTLDQQLNKMQGIASGTPPEEPFSAVPQQDGVANRVPAPQVDPNVAGQPPELNVDQQLQEIINTPATDYTTISKKQATDAMGSKFNTQLDKRMAVDPEAKKQAVTETLSGPSQTPVLDAEGKPVIGPDGKPVMKATGGYDRQGKAEGLAKYLKQKEDLDKAALDPDAIAKRRNQAYIDGLITGGTGRTGTAARSQFDANIAKSKQDSISEQKAMYMEDMKFDNEIADKIGTQALKVFEVYTTDVAKAMDTASTIGIANLDMFYKEAKMAYDSNQDGIKNKIDAIKTSTVAKLDELIQSQATMREISSAAINLTKEVGKLKENFYSTLAAEKLGIESELTKKETTPERRKQLLAQLDEYELRFAAQKEILEADAFMQILKTMMEESGRNNGFSSQTKQQVQQIVKTSTGTSQQQTTGGSSRGISSVLGGQQTGALATLNKYAPAG